MARPDVAVRPRRSAFAAAFLSFLFPGLGHAYLGRWLRALLWAALPIVGIVAVAGFALSTTREQLIELAASPDFLNALLIFLVIDVFYRFFAMLDAYRLATDGSVGSGFTRLLSTGGLVAIIVVLVGSHVAVAQPVLYVQGLYGDLVEESGDDSPILTPEQVEALGPGWDLGLDELAAASPGADSTPRAADRGEATNTPTDPPTPAPDPTPEPTQGPDWNGTERLNILLIGQDGGRQGRNDGSLLTDTMITVSIDPVTGRLAFISLPRDTTNIPLPKSWAAARAFGGVWKFKVNTLYSQARFNPSLFPGNDRQRGYTALMGALGQLYGLDIKYYVSVDLNSFRSVVNALKGVVVDVQLPVMDTGYATGDGRGKLKLYVQPGMRKLNGQNALAYARSRHGSSDFDRAARQQRIVTSVRDQTDIGSLLADPALINSLIKQLQKDVKTNIPPKIVPKLLSLASKLDLDSRENLVLSSSKYVTTCYPCNGTVQWMLKVNPSAVRKDVKNVFSTSQSKQRQINQVRDEGAKVYVLNGQGGLNTKAINIASNLAGRGIDAIVPPVNDGKANDSDFTGTVIRAYNGAEETMPQTLKRLKRSLNDKQRVIEFVESSTPTADFVVVVGSKTKKLKG